MKNIFMCPAAGYECNFGCAAHLYCIILLCIKQAEPRKFRQQKHRHSYFAVIIKNNECHL